MPTEKKALLEETLLSGTRPEEQRRDERHQCNIERHENAQFMPLTSNTPERWLPIL